jgi:RNA polymerase-binding transcription factor DksA
MERGHFMHPAMEKYLADAQRDLEQRRQHIQVGLGQRRRDLLDATGYQMQEGTRANHPADEASDMIAAETDLSWIQDLEAETHDVDDALGRVERGTYGICISCGAAIDPARLHALPAAQRCYRCQTEVELALDVRCAG